RVPTLRVDDRQPETLLGRRKMIVELGAVYTTANAQTALEQAGKTADEYVLRHANGDWGELGTAEVRDNQTSLKEGFRIFSTYTLATGTKICVFTEEDRSVTAVYLPEETHLVCSPGGTDPVSVWTRAWRR